MWYGFVTVHMFLLNVSSTVSLYSHPRCPLWKPPNYLRPLVLPIDLVPTRRLPPSFNQNIRHILIRSRQTHMRIDVETNYMGFLDPSPIPQFVLTFFYLGFLVWFVHCCGHYIWRLFLHSSIRSRCLRADDEEGVKEAFEVVAELSESW